jgi:hypothetical protein
VAVLERKVGGRGWKLYNEHEVGKDVVTPTYSNSGIKYKKNYLPGAAHLLYNAKNAIFVPTPTPNTRVIVNTG